MRTLQGQHKSLKTMRHDPDIRQLEADVIGFFCDEFAQMAICSDPYDYLPIRSYPVLFARLMISHLLDQIDQGAL